MEEGLIIDLKKVEEIFEYSKKKQIKLYDSIADNDLPTIDETDNLLIHIKNKNPITIRKLVERIQHEKRDRIFELEECIDFCFDKNLSITFVRILLRHIYTCSLLTDNGKEPICIHCSYTDQQGVEIDENFEVYAKKMSLMKLSDVSGWKYSNNQGEHVFFTKKGVMVILNPKSDQDNQVEGLRWIMKNLMSDSRPVYKVGFDELETQLKAKCHTMMTVSMMVEIIRAMRYYFHLKRNDLDPDTHEALVQLSIGNKTIDLTKVLKYSFISPFRFNWCNDYCSNSEVELNWRHCLEGTCFVATFNGYVFYRLGETTFAVYNESKTTLMEAISMSDGISKLAIQQINRCNWCNKTASRKCPCGNSHYCNITCQNLDWKSHRVAFYHERKS